MGLLQLQVVVAEDGGSYHGGVVVGIVVLQVVGHQYSTTTGSAAHPFDLGSTSTSTSSSS